ncbi:hypothetical protein ABZ154_04005 [Streptomyces sp. NPDC006261]|uniref:hypothetical protein n=1 Tax=Streptomyces sp. NPDC006261 TaxID=3156739 RepID=UPI0033B98A56
MPLTSLLSGAALFLAGLTLAADYRGAAALFANTFLDPNQGDRAILRHYARRGVDHPELHYFNEAPRQPRFVRLGGGFAMAIGLVFLAGGVLSLVRG